VLGNDYPGSRHNQEKSISEITAELQKWFQEISAKQQALAHRALAKKNMGENRVHPGFKKGDWILP
jgi:hypothetical protein